MFLLLEPMFFSTVRFSNTNKYTKAKKVMLHESMSNSIFFSWLINNIAAMHTLLILTKNVYCSIITSAVSY